MASKSGTESDGKRLRQKWSDDSMLAAVEAVRTSKMSISVAANWFKVPRKTQTLDDRLKGRVQHGTHPGVSTVLTVQEENSLINYLLHMAQCGFPLTRTMVKSLCLVDGKALWHCTPLSSRIWSGRSLVEFIQEEASRVSSSYSQ